MTAPQAACTVEGCSRSSKARGLCSSHYIRKRRHGDPLAGDLPGAPRLCIIDGCEGQHEARGWCRKHYRRFQRNGDPNVFIPRYDDVDEALRTRIEKTGDCLVWTGAKSIDGYGRIRYRGEARCVHRVAWERRYGSEPEGLELDHLCRNRACINVAHLEPVTHAENMRRTRQTVLVERQREWQGEER